MEEEGGSSTKKVRRKWPAHSLCAARAQEAGPSEPVESEEDLNRGRIRDGTRSPRRASTQRCTTCARHLKHCHPCCHCGHPLCLPCSETVYTANGPDFPVCRQCHTSSIIVISDE
eukprot:6490714-Amphidinium_carterae.2